MDKIVKTKLSERAELVKRLAELDVEILERYSILASSPKIASLECGTKFIEKARKDCNKLLHCFRGKPHRILKMLLESPYGVLDSDETVITVFERDPDGNIHELNFKYINQKLKLRKLPYRIIAHKHGVIRLLPR